MPAWFKVLFAGVLSLVSSCKSEDWIRHQLRSVRYGNLCAAVRKADSKLLLDGLS